MKKSIYENPITAIIRRILCLSPNQVLSFLIKVAFWYTFISVHGLPVVAAMAAIHIPCILLGVPREFLFTVPRLPRWAQLYNIQVFFSKTQLQSDDNWVFSNKDIRDNPTYCSLRLRFQIFFSPNLYTFMDAHEELLTLASRPVQMFYLKEYARHISHKGKRLVLDNSKLEEQLAFVRTEAARQRPFILVRAYSLIARNLRYIGSRFLGFFSSSKNMATDLLTLVRTAPVVAEVLKKLRLKPFGDAVFSRIMRVTLTDVLTAVTLVVNVCYMKNPKLKFFNLMTLMVHMLGVLDYSISDIMPDYDFKMTGVQGGIFSVAEDTIEGISAMGDKAGNLVSQFDKSLTRILKVDTLAKRMVALKDAFFDYFAHDPSLPFIEWVKEAEIIMHLPEIHAHHDISIENLALRRKTLDDSVILALPTASRGSLDVYRKTSKKYAEWYDSYLGNALSIGDTSTISAMFYGKNGQGKTIISRLFARSVAKAFGWSENAMFSKPVDKQARMDGVVNNVHQILMADEVGFRTDGDSVGVALESIAGFTDDIAYKPEQAELSQKGKAVSFKFVFMTSNMIFHHVQAVTDSDGHGGTTVRPIFAFDDQIQDAGAVVRRFDKNIRVRRRVADDPHYTKEEFPGSDAVNLDPSSDFYIRKWMVLELVSEKDPTNHFSYKYHYAPREIDPAYMLQSLIHARKIRDKEWEIKKRKIAEPVYGLSYGGLTFPSDLGQLSQDELTSLRCYETFYTKGEEVFIPQESKEVANPTPLMEDIYYENKANLRKKYRIVATVFTLLVVVIIIGTIYKYFSGMTGEVQSDETQTGELKPVGKKPKKTVAQTAGTTKVVGKKPRKAAAQGGLVYADYKKTIPMIDKVRPYADTSNFFFQAKGRRPVFVGDGDASDFPLLVFGQNFNGGTFPLKTVSEVDPSGLATDFNHCWKVEENGDIHQFHVNEFVLIDQKPIAELLAGETQQFQESVVKICNNMGQIRVTYQGNTRNSHILGIRGEYALVNKHTFSFASSEEPAFDHIRVWCPNKETVFVNGSGMNQVKVIKEVTTQVSDLLIIRLPGFLFADISKKFLRANDSPSFGGSHRLFMPFYAASSNQYLSGHFLDARFINAVKEVPDIGGPVASHGFYEALDQPTRKGDCGSPYIDKRGRIVAVHFARGDFCFGAALTGMKIPENTMTTVQSSYEYDYSLATLSKQVPRGVMRVGYLSETIYCPRKSKLRPSFAQESGHLANMAPRELDFTTKNGLKMEADSYYWNKIPYVTNDIDEPDYIIYSGKATKGLSTQRDITVGADDEMNPMYRNSSGGIEARKISPNGKRDFIDVTDGRGVFTPLFMDFFKKLLEPMCVVNGLEDHFPILWKKFCNSDTSIKGLGRADPTFDWRKLVNIAKVSSIFYGMGGKDELVTQEVAALGKWRPINWSDMRYTVLSKWLLWEWASDMRKKRHSSGPQIGINAQSVEFDMLISRLMFCGPKALALDAKGFDLTLHRQLLVAWACQVLYFYREQPMSLQVLRASLMKSFIDRLNVYGRMVYFTGSSQCSGQALTAESNSYCSDLITRTIHTRSGSLNSYDRAIYGDDLLIAVPEEEDKFTMNYFRDQAKILFDMTYTDSEKNAEFDDFVDLLDADFISRSFRRNPDVPGRILGSLKESRVREIALWTKGREEEDLTNYINSCNSALLEMWPHGREAYGRLLRIVHDGMHRAGAEYMFPTYDQRVLKYMQ